VVRFLHFYPCISSSRLLPLFFKCRQIYFCFPFALFSPTFPPSFYSVKVLATVVMVLMVLIRVAVVRSSLILNSVSCFPWFACPCLS
jgi:hypothetical protein